MSDQDFMRQLAIPVDTVERTRLDSSVAYFLSDMNAGYFSMRQKMDRDFEMMRQGGGGHQSLGSSIVFNWRLE